MSLPKPKVQRSFFDVAFVANDLFDPKDRFSLFHEKILPALERQRSTLSQLYCEDNGRPALDPVVMAGVTLLQFMEKVPDQKATEEVKLNLGWKYALNLDISYKGFHPTSLVYFRERILESQKERVIFDGILEALRKEGLVKKQSKQRLDSTHVFGCVAQMGRLEIVRETIRLLCEEIEKQALQSTLPEWSLLKDRYCDSEVNWHKQTKDELTKRFLEAGGDAWRLIQWCENSPLKEHNKSLLLRRVFDEQFDRQQEQIQRRKIEGSGVVKNPHDPEAQWSTKDSDKKKQWVGYKAQVMETVSDEGQPQKKGEPTQQFITEIITTEAIASDLDGMNRTFKAQRDQGQEDPSELYVDAAYVTDDTLAEAKEQGRELMGPARPSPRCNGIFPVDQFEIDVENRKAICPQGKTSSQCSVIHGHDQIESVYLRFEWASQCDHCPAQEACTKSKNGRRTVMVGIHHDLLQERRQQMQTDDFKNRMRQRNAIEGTISELTRNGMRRTRYRGLSKTRLANYFIGATCNVKRWIRLLQWQPAPT